MALVAKKPAAPAAATVEFLNVGTQILTKDVMDQFIRTLGNNRTHYAGGAANALRILKENKISVMITESELVDSSVIRFVNTIRESRLGDDLFIALAVGEEDAALQQLASELEADWILVKPFTANDLAQLVSKFKSQNADKNSPRMMIRRAEAEFRDKAYTQAAKYYLAAAKAAPDDAFVQFKVGSYYIGQPEKDLGLKHLLKALEINKEYVPAISELGRLFLQKKNYKKAFDYLSQAQALSPYNPDRAQLLVQLHMDWAMQTVKSALLKDKNDQDLRYLFGKIQLFRKDYASALQEIRASKIDKASPLFVESVVMSEVAKKLGSLK